MSDTGPRNILLVEDEPTLQRILGSVLGDAGHHVDAVGTAEHALDRLDDGADVDLVLTDKNLPKKTGLELLADIRAQERSAPGRRPIGVMMVTGYPSRDSALQALADDADGYLVKPFRSLTHAVDTIQRVLEADLVTRRKGPPLARKLGNALAGLPEPLAGVSVAVVSDTHGAVVERALRAAGARVVPVDQIHRAQAIVAARMEDIHAATRQRAGLGCVLLDGGASFQDVVELIGCGGGVVVDPGIVEARP